MAVNTNFNSNQAMEWRFQFWTPTYAGCKNGKVSMYDNFNQTKPIYGWRHFENVLW